MKRLCPVLAALLLAACGGSGAGSAGAEATPPPPPAMPGDAFTAALVILVRDAPDSAEPADTGAVLPAMPDSGEPIAIE